MKSFIAGIFALLLVSQANAKVPRQITVVGECQKIDNKIVFLKTEKGFAKVPITSSVDRHPACFKGKRFVARVPIRAYLDLN